MSEWKECKLIDISKHFAMGPFGSNIKAENFVESGVPVIRGTNMNTYKYVGGNFVFLTEEKADQLKSSNCFPGDLVFTHRGTLGQVGVIPKNNYPRYVISQSGMKVTVNIDLVDTGFLFYFFKSEIGQHELLQHESQVGVPSISNPLTSLKSVNILLPPLAEQKAIAGVLSALDDKIDLLHRQNKTLEAMAEALFRQWFVEEADETWEEGKLGDLVEVKYGKNHKSLLDGNFPVYGSGGIMRYADKSLYDCESVLIPRKGSLNNVVYINEPFWVVDTMFYTIMRKPFIAKFIFEFVKNLNLSSMNVGSAVPSMTTEVLNNLPIQIPSDLIFKDFDIKLNPIYNKTKTNKAQIRSLEKLRDTLLPKLMSGEVRV
jgi:type I restriction enzyme S subunit